MFPRWLTLTVAGHVPTGDPVCSIVTVTATFLVSPAPIVWNGVGLLLRDEYVTQQYFWRSAPTPPLFNNCNEVVHGHAADAPVRAGISRCQDERLVTRSDGSVNVNGRSTFFHSLDERERVAGRSDRVTRARIHPHCGKGANANCRRVFRL